MRWRTFVLAAALASLPVAGCARGDSPDVPAPRHDRLTVQVKNDNWADMTVYLRRGASRIRLGSVSSQGESTFTLSAATTGASPEMWLEADPIGSRQIHRSGTVLVDTGRVISWTIASRPGLSLMSIR